MNIISGIIRLQVAEIEIISLKARKEAAEYFCMNNDMIIESHLYNDMIIESHLLQEQISALEDEINHMKTYRSFLQE